MKNGVYGSRMIGCTCVGYCILMYHIEYKVEFQKYGTDSSSFPGGTKAITRLGPPPKSACSSTDGPNIHWIVKLC